MDIGSFIHQLQDIQKAHGDDLRVGVMLKDDLDDSGMVVLEDAMPVVLDGPKGPNAVMILPQSIVQETP